MELDYWGIEPIKDPKVEELVEVFNKVHMDTVAQEVVEMWKRSGSWDIQQAIEEGKLKIQQDLPIVKLQLTPDFYYIGQAPTLKGSFIGRLEDKDGIAEGVFMHNADYPAGVSLNGFGRDFDADSYYEGSFKESKPEGYGRLVYRSGNVQEGQWHQANFCGQVGPASMQIDL